MANLFEYFDLKSFEADFLAHFLVRKKKMSIFKFKVMKVALNAGHDASLNKYDEQGIF